MEEGGSMDDSIYDKASNSLRYSASNSDSNDSTSNSNRENISEQEIEHEEDEREIVSYRYKIDITNHDSGS